MSDKVLVLGAYGMLGSSLCPSLKSAGYLVLHQGRRASAELSFDPGDLEAMTAVLDEYRPHAVVNLIADSNVDSCEDDPGSAFSANVRPVDALLDAIKITQSCAHLVQISTDHLYDGPGPHKEFPVHPRNVYALTKYAADLRALNGGATVLRTNFFGRSQSQARASFSDWILQSVLDCKDITVFEDVYFSAMHMVTLSNVVAKVIEKRLGGVFNIGCRDGMSKAEFAFFLAKELELDVSHMKTGSVKTAKLRTIRPADMRLDVTAAEKAFEIQLPYMREQISMAAEEYRGFENVRN
jgi:dTDP-4-dehydrorhamnose reductase